jgi:hypothetical protein
LITIIFIALSAFLNAVMDRVEYGVAFRVSIFRNLNPKFWQKDVSWEFAKKVFGWKFDAWHVAKSLMIISFTVGIVLYKPIFGIIDILIFGAVWNIVFNVFYNNILKHG